MLSVESIQHKKKSAEGKLHSGPMLRLSYSLMQPQLHVFLPGINSREGQLQQTVQKHF